MKIIIFNKKTDSDACWKIAFKKQTRNFGFLLILFMTGLYVFQVGEMAKETYAVQKSNAELNQIIKENRSSEYEFLYANSLNRIESIIEDSDFERIGSIHYIEAGDTQIAAR